MTRDELREKVARALDEQLWEDRDKGISIGELTIAMSLRSADAAIDTIFAALKEPTEEMMQTIGATSVQRLVWQKMISASPLAPKE